MKKTICVLCSVMILFSCLAGVLPFAASAEIDYTCGENITWSLDIITCELKITGTGEMFTYSAGEHAPWLSYNNYIKTAEISEGITDICYGAFENCYMLESVSLPSTLKRIGDHAFAQTSSLKSLDLPSGIEYIGTHAFFLSKIEELGIPEGVKEIGELAFWACRKLKKLSLPSTIQKLDINSILADTESLEEVEFPNGCGIIDPFLNTGISLDSKWYNDITEGPVYFGDILIEYKGDIPEGTTVEIKEGTRAIYPGVFKDKAGLTDIVLPDSLIDIGADAFAGTAWLDNQPDGDVYAGRVYLTYKGQMGLGQEVNIKEGTLGIADNAFYSMDLLEEITFPDSLVFIGSNAFYNTYRLKDVPIKSGLKYIDNKAFDRAGIRNVVLPASLEYLGGYAFNLSDLCTVTFEKGFSIEIIREGTFDCSKFTELSVPNSVKIIEKDALVSIVATSVIKVTVPASVVEIHKNAIRGSKTTIYCYEYSAAHEYAVENSINFVLLDGSVEEEIVFTDLNNVLARAKNIKRDFYSEESLKLLDDAVAAVNTQAEGLKQETVDAWATDIENAIENLKYKPADYYSLELALARANGIDRSLYTEESLVKLDAALEKGFDNELDITNQGQVSAYAKEINMLVDELEYKPADYGKVNEAVRNAQSIDRSFYTAATLTALDQSIGFVVYGLDISYQSTVDMFAQKINSALASLEHSEITLKNDIHGVIISATAREIHPKTELAVDKLDPSNIESANFAVGGYIKSVEYFDICLVKDAVNVQPNGTVSVKIRIPEGVNPEKCRIYHVTEDPVDPLVRFSSTLNGNYIVFKTDHFSEFALIEVETVLTGISITRMPDKLEYSLNESVDFSGMEITAEMSNGALKTVTDYDVSGVNTSTEGKKTVMIYYTLNGVTKSASFEINVVSRAVNAQILLDGKEITEYNRQVKWYKGYSSEKLKLDCNLSESNGYKFEFSSDNSKVKVDNYGNVTNEGFFFARKANITLKVTDGNGRLIATDTVTLRFYKFNFQLSGINSFILF